MREDDDRRGIGKALHIIGKPSQLLCPKHAHAASLKVHYIVETDEMDSVLVEGIPTGALGILAVPLEIGLERDLVEIVVLAWHVMHIETHAADDLSGVVEFLGLRQMGDVAGMKHECRLFGKRFDLRDCLLQSTKCIGIGFLVESDMAVGNLQERE